MKKKIKELKEKKIIVNDESDTEDEIDSENEVDNLEKKIKDEEEKVFDATTITDFVACSKSYRVLLTKEQERIFKDNFAAVRKIWNLCLHEIRKSKTGLDQVKEYELRNKFMTKKRMNPIIIKNIKWTFRTQKRIREYAIKDLCSSIKGGVTRLLKKQIKRFVINSKSKDVENESIVLCKEGSYIKDNKLHVYGMDLKIEENVKDIKKGNIKSNMRLVREGLNYYLHIPEFINPDKNMKDSSKVEGIVSIDLGVNIFGTYYSPDKEEWGELGLGFKDRLISIYNKEESIRRRVIGKNRIYKALRKNRSNLFNLVNDFQWKGVHWFLRNFKEILVSRLYVGKSTGINKRYMNDSKHCRFVDRLIYKCMFYNGRIIHEGKEHHTSQHCTVCGSLDTQKDTIVKCNSCNEEIHRDLSGSRNFLLKYLLL